MENEEFVQLPFPRAAEVWLASRKNINDGAHSTKYMYACYIRALMKFFGERKLIDCANIELISAYQRDRKAGTVPGLRAAGNGLVNHEINTLQQMLVCADLWSKISRWYQPLQQKPSKVGRALNPEDEKRLFEVASGRPRWMVAYCCALISANTTADPGEIRHLRLRDIELNRKVFHVREGLKTGFRERSIPMNPDALWAFTALCDRARSKGCHLPEHYLLPHRAHVRGAGWDPFTPMFGWRSAWENLREAAGLPTLRLKDLRHHAITTLLSNPNVSERTVVELAGHVNSRMLDTYSHQREATKAAAVEALSGGNAPVNPVKLDQLPPPEPLPRKAISWTGGTASLSGASVSPLPKPERKDDGETETKKQLSPVLVLKRRSGS